LMARSELGLAHAARLQGEASELATQTGKLLAVASAEFGRGMLAMARWQWPTTVDAFQSAITLYKRNPTPDGRALREQDLCEILSLMCETYCGRYVDAAVRQARLRRMATERGNIFLQVAIEVGYGSFVDLASDRPGHVRRATERAMARWSTPSYSL